MIDTHRLANLIADQLERDKEDLPESVRKNPDYYRNVRNAIMRGENVPSEIWGGVSRSVGRILGVRSGVVRRQKSQEKIKHPLFTEKQIKKMMEESLININQRRDHLLADP